MELAGKIIYISEPRNGVSKTTGNPWAIQTFVLETHEQFPRKMAFEVFGEERLRTFNIQMGEELNVFFDIDAHEYQGRWFNSIRAWRVERVDPNQPANPADPTAAAAPVPNGAQAFQQQPAPQAAPQQAPTTVAPTFNNEDDSTSDLPF